MNLRIFARKYEHKIRRMNSTVQSTVYSVDRNHIEWLCGITPAAYQIASTPYYDFTRSHQLRTMTLRSHINSVPWLYAVTSTPYLVSALTNVTLCWLSQVPKVLFLCYLNFAYCIASWQRCVKFNINFLIACCLTHIQPRLWVNRQIDESRPWNETETR